MSGERDSGPSREELLAQMLEFVSVEPAGGDGEWIGQPPHWWSGDYLFGGLVISQAIVAATRNAPEGRRLHSMHVYFLRPALASAPITYSVDPIREGRAFTSRHLRAAQSGKDVLEIACSFTADTDGYVYDLGGSCELPDRDQGEPDDGPGPWVASYIGPTDPLADETRESTHRAWFRIPGELPDDVHLYTALLGFASDWTGIGGRPLHLEGDTEGMVSLDHAVWFHRPARADQWLFFDVQALVNAGGRGLLRGVMRDEDGRVVVSVAQEMKLAVIDS